MRLKWLMILSLLVLLLAACGSGLSEGDVPTLAPSNGEDTGSEGATDNADNNDAQAATGTETGETANAYTVSITGDVVSGDGYTGTRDEPAKYEPYGTGSNAEGPYSVDLYIDATLNGEPIGTYAQIVFEVGTTTGTYDLTDTTNDGSPRGRVVIDSTEFQDIDENVSGTVTFDTLTPQLVSGTFEFNAENEEGLTATVSGSFTEIAYIPDTELDFTYTGLAEGDNTLGVSSQVIDGGVIAITTGGGMNSFILYIDPAIDPGTYQSSEDGPLRIDSFIADEVGGTVTFTETGDYFSGELDVTFTDDGETGGISGTFDFIERPANN